MSGEIVVLKFGSSVLESWSDAPSAVHEIYGWYRSGHRVIAVVSAIGCTTNGLIAQAAELSPSPEPYALAELLATGERNAAAFLGIALDRAGIPARVVDPREIHLTAQGKPLDREPTLVGQSKLQEQLASRRIERIFGMRSDSDRGRQWTDSRRLCPSTILRGASAFAERLGRYDLMRAGRTMRVSVETHRSSEKLVFTDIFSLNYNKCSVYRTL